ncbi:MAG TPA: glycosyltransferase family 4 protein [Stellaceae bacterium]|nr:glycosyltransferase family 4 protein [Stellaceae bacterium]
MSALRTVATAIGGFSLSGGAIAKLDRVSGPRPLMIAYWGRRGLSQFTFELSAAALSRAEPRVTFSLSSANESLPRFAPLGERLCVVDTFRSNWAPIVALPRLVRLRRRLLQRFAVDGTRAFVSLMPHIWSPLVAPVIRSAGVRHIVVMHDAEPHPGDRTGLATGWLAREAHQCDHVIALSRFVAERLAELRGLPRDKVSPLFHPEFTFDQAPGQAPMMRRAPAGPLRLLFIGRLLGYKGFGIFMDAIELLLRSGRRIEIGVFGSGNLATYERRLAAIGAEVDNRWIDDREFSGILARHDLVVLSHTEASQSGVVAAAHGAGLPVVITPVGGLIEQVVPDLTGVVARSATAEAVAAAIARLLDEPALLARLYQGVAETHQQRSMAHFLDRLIEIALPDPR